MKESAAGEDTLGEHTLEETALGEVIVEAEKRRELDAVRERSGWCSGCSRRRRSSGGSNDGLAMIPAWLPPRETLRVEGIRGAMPPTTLPTTPLATPPTAPRTPRTAPLAALLRH